MTDHGDGEWHASACECPQCEAVGAAPIIGNAEPDCRHHHWVAQGESLYECELCGEQRDTAEPCAHTYMAVCRDGDYRVCKCSQCGQEKES